MPSTSEGGGSAYDVTIGAGLRPAPSPVEAAQFDAAVAHRIVERLRDKVDKAELHLKDARASLTEAETNAKAADKALTAARKAAKSEGGGS